MSYYLHPPGSIVPIGAWHGVSCRIYQLDEFTVKNTLEGILKSIDCLRQKKHSWHNQTQDVASLTHK
jgi:hypothetical protein